MQFRSTYLIRLMLLGLIFGTHCAVPGYSSADNNNRRNTPLVQAVQGCSMSVVNLRGRKTVPTETTDGTGKTLKQVNGMGTGVVIDERGYVLTNYHVVQGVKEIEVTTSDGQKTIAELLAHDPETDLAVLKIDVPNPLPKIKIGCSSDLMLAETVSAVGNAYGYEHTVTVGIVSQFGRTVQVNDNQIYRNLIQTDAAINPGNSGGPLLNMNGEMIGINVAVRIGAQGIAFAIPVNDAMDVAAKLMGQLVSDEISHGLSAKTIYIKNRPQLIVESVDAKGPAASVGLARGDRIISIDGEPVERELDLQSALLGARPNHPLDLRVAHGSHQTNVTLALEPRKDIGSALAWESLGIRVDLVSESQMSNLHPNYKRGLKVTRVRPNSPAESEGIVPGDIIVAMRGYKTESLENLAYVLQRTDVAQQKSFMFYILRDKEPFWGQMRVAQRITR